MIFIKEIVKEKLLEQEGVWSQFDKITGGEDKVVKKI